MFLICSPRDFLCCFDGKLQAYKLFRKSTKTKNRTHGGGFIVFAFFPPCKSCFFLRCVDGFSNWMDFQFFSCLVFLFCLSNAKELPSLPLLLSFVFLCKTDLKQGRLWLLSRRFWEKSRPHFLFGFARWWAVVLRAAAAVTTQQQMNESHLAYVSRCSFCGFDGFLDFVLSLTLS